MATHHQCPVKSSLRMLAVGRYTMYMNFIPTNVGTLTQECSRYGVLTKAHREHGESTPVSLPLEIFLSSAQADMTHRANATYIWMR